MLNDRDVQKIMKEVDTQELAMALKSADSDIQDKIFKNMSKRAENILREDMEYMGPVRLIDVENSQNKIASIISYLAEIGEISLDGMGELVV